MGLKKKEVKILVKKINEELERVSKQNDDTTNPKILVEAERGKDEVDQATSEYERSQMMRMQRRDRLYEKKLLKTLGKVDNNEYGICEECGDDIKFERLSARPTAELCIVCKDEAEKEERNNYITGRSKSLGETISFGSRP